MSDLKVIPKPDEELEEIRRWQGRLKDADREALKLICAVGIFALHDGAKLGDAVDRLWDSEGWSKRWDGAEAAGKLSAAMDSLHVDRSVEILDAAYLLGIAVGQRLAHFVAPTEAAQSEPKAGDVTEVELEGI